MTVGEVIAALVKYASDFDGNYMLMVSNICSIEVDENKKVIEIYYADGNTSDVVIDKDGKFVSKL